MAARCAALALMVADAPAAAAAEGRTPISKPGTVISSAGRYVLTRNLVGGGGIPVIEVAAPGVDLDLNGFVIDNAAGVVEAVLVSAPGDVSIRNGAIRNAHVGVHAPAGGTRILLEDLQIRSCDPAIRVVDVGTVVLRRVLVEGPGNAIRIEGAAVKVGTVEDCIVRDAANGIAVDNASGFAVVRNHVEGTTGEGISLSGCSGCLVAENEVTRASSGIVVTGSSAVTLRNNAVSDCRTNGIRINGSSEDVAALDNVVVRNGFPAGGNGLLVEGDRAFLSGNVLNDNNGVGLWLSSGSSDVTFGRNTARGNAGSGGAVCGAAPPLFPPNSCNDGAGNTSFGDNLIPGPPPF